MNISKIPGINPIENPVNYRKDKNQEEAKEVHSKNKGPRDMYDHTSLEEGLTTYNKDHIFKLKEATEKNKLKLINIIKESISRQGQKIGLLDFENITEIDDLGRAELEDLISEDGELGIEKTSQRLVDFAQTISGGDRSKADLLRDAIDQGFKEAEKLLGGELPQISKDTYKRTMDLLDQWLEGSHEE